MVLFGYFKYKHILKFAWQHFGTQSLLWVKISLDPMVGSRGLEKINVHKYIIYSFSTAIGPHVCCSWNITKQKKIEKLRQCPFIKFPLFWYGSGFFFFLNIFLCIYCCKMKKNTHFLMEFHPNFFNLYMVLDLIHVYQYHTP